MNAPILQETHRVSAKLMAGEEADAIAAAAYVDNDEIEVEDHGSYITINGPVRLEFSIETGKRGVCYHPHTGGQARRILTHRRS